MNALKFLALWGLGTLSLAGTVHAADDNMAGLKTANGKLAYEFINLWFNEHKPREAFDKYVSRDHYMNHVVYSATTRNPLTFEQEKEAEAAIVPAGARFDIKQIIAQGSLVFIHIHAFGETKDNTEGDELMELLRIEDGKVVDHWDMWTAMKPDSAVFAGLNRFDKRN